MTENIDKGQTKQEEKKFKNIIEETKHKVNTSNELLEKYKEKYESEKKEAIEKQKEVNKEKQIVLEEAIKEAKKELKKFNPDFTINEDVVLAKNIEEYTSDIKETNHLKLYFGKGKSFFNSLIGTIVVGAGLIGFSAYMQKIPFSTDIIKWCEENRDAILGYYSFGLNVGDKTITGSAVLGGTLLVLFAIFYTIGILSRKINNSGKAKKHEKKVKKYIDSVESKIKEFKTINMYLDKEIKTLQLLTILIKEKLGVLKRIKHIENVTKKEDVKNEKSLHEIELLEELVKSAEDLIDLKIINDKDINTETLKVIGQAEQTVKSTLNEIYDGNIPKKQ